MKNARKVGALVGALVLSAAWPGAPGDLPAQPEKGSPAPLSLACSPTKPVASLGETLRVTAWAAAPAGQTLRYTWAATAGRLDGEGNEVRWTLSGVAPGPHTATVRVEEPRGSIAECSVQVIVRLPPARGLPRESGWSFLPPSQAEAEGYGLYSYLLLGAPPGAATRERYLQGIEAYLGLMPDITSLERYVQSRRELNVAYLPIAAPPGPAVSAEWALEHYDYARSRILLRAVPGSHREGPYIISSLKPLSGAAALSGQYLYQDLSSVPPHVVSPWIKEFLNQAAQERFWEGRAAERLALKLRTTIGILALGLPDVRKGLESWITWMR